MATTHQFLNRKKQIRKNLNRGTGKKGAETEYREKNRPGRLDTMAEDRLRKKGDLRTACQARINSLARGLGGHQPKQRGPGKVGEDAPSSRKGQIARSKKLPFRVHGAEKKKHAEAATI